MSARTEVPHRRPLTLDEYVTGVRAGDRAILARTITLLESQLPADQALGEQVLERLLPHTGAALRVGITGVPGVGKSTFIEALGTRLLDQGSRLAVLAIDPSSTRSGGSILGDKTRMQRLSADARAFIRPSPSAGTLGGVARKTREAILICEAAGFDVVIVETVGVGQSETLVADLVDCFLVLMLAGAGDELQGIKRGVLELADVVAVNKADGAGLAPAKLAAAQLEQALRYLRPRLPEWHPPVLTCSAREGAGLDDVWAQVLAHRQALQTSGAWDERRSQQQVRWMWSLVQERLRVTLERHASVRPLLPDLERQVAEGRLTPSAAARRILAAFSGEEPTP